MSAAAPVSRRLLLGRLGSGTGVVGTFLLPAVAARRHGRRREPATPRCPAQASAARTPAATAPLVMLDPGHGGKDPGAIGVSGTYEKHVSLATALELKRLLEAGGHYRVALTRARDVFVPLDDRVAKAQAQGASLFVSMHADALADHQVRGASIYTLGNTASDAQTAALAQRENSADRYGGPALHTSPEVARILASLVRRETRVGSVHLARDLVGSLDQEVPMLPNPGAPCRLRRAEGGRYPQRAGRDGLHVQPARRGGTAPPGPPQADRRGDEARGGRILRRPPADGGIRLKGFHPDRKCRLLVSLRGAERRSNPLPDERSSARQAGDCFVAPLLAMTGEFAA